MRHGSAATGPDASASRPLLEVVDLATWFTTSQGVIRAVDGVSLTVYPGRSLGVVGESGSGKTQTFYGVLGLTRGSPGVVRGAARFADTDILLGLDEHVAFAGAGPTMEVRKSVRAWSARHMERVAPLLGHDVAILFQDPRRSLVPYWTIGRHLREVIARRTGARSALGMFSRDAAWRDEACALLAELGFSDPPRILSSFPEALSGGEAQRAMLALTMAMRPRLLIADEPTTGLDTINQARVLMAITELHRRTGMALVLISHDLAVVDSMVEDVVVMYGGRVMAASSTKLLREQPDEALHPYALDMRDSQARRASGKRIEAVSMADPSPPARTGCPFRHRCSLRPRLSKAVQDQCASEAPAPIERSDTSWVACWGVTE